MGARPRRTASTSRIDPRGSSSGTACPTMVGKVPVECSPRRSVRRPRRPPRREHPACRSGRRRRPTAAHDRGPGRDLGADRGRSELVSRPGCRGRDPAPSTHQRRLESVVQPTRNARRVRIFVDGRCRWRRRPAMGPVPRSGRDRVFDRRRRGGPRISVTRAVRALIGVGFGDWACTGSRSGPASTTRGAARSPERLRSSARGSSAGAKRGSKGVLRPSSCTRSSRTNGRAPAATSRRSSSTCSGRSVHEFLASGLGGLLETSAARSWRPTSTRSRPHGR